MFLGGGFFRKTEFCTHLLGTIGSEGSTVSCPLPSCFEFLILILLQIPEIYMLSLIFGLNMCVMLLVGRFWDTFLSLRSQSSSSHCYKMEFSVIDQGISKIVVSLYSEYQFESFQLFLVSSQYKVGEKHVVFTKEQVPL